MAITFKRVKTDTGAVTLPSSPSVNLLPPSQTKVLEMQRAVRVIAALGIGFVIVNGALFAYASGSSTTASRTLAAEQATTSQLQTTLRQNSQVLTIDDQITQLEQDRIAVTAREGDWQDLLNTVTNATPQGMAITTFNVQTVGSTSSGSSSSTSKPSADNIGTVKVTAESDDLPNISQWIDNVRVINGVADVTAQQIDNKQQSSSGTNKDTSRKYQSQLTITLNASRFTNRFVTDDSLTMSGDTTAVQQGGN
ncbi:hypothetical protein [Pseudoclavibacter caeni]|jgi:hypothetical protein|uniref:PilN domain-containing protein n=1 Tax=Pseudoclavibacter caeni TaxID=908846 RepID=A0A7C8BNS0_9MICO|nr:hypothetical protein [Pseudoclavibacter caeni]KAB1632933.1 hypothetical protein F8O02_03495 [Pseudoclavibacter caeni]NYJ97098.1 hypothetical protein [Pseudoclavibacter caeni]